MKTYSTCLFVLAVCFIISYIADVEGQRRNNQRNNRQGNKRRPQRKPPNKPPPTEGGLWVPRRQLIANAQRRRQQQSAKQSNKNKPNKGNANFEDIISPPLYRSKGGPDLQEPSWTHCVNHLHVDENWARFMSPGYPRNISGQVQCTWMIYGIRGMRLRLSFNDLDLANGVGGRCGNQYVDVIDMELLNSQGLFCGSLIPGDYVSVGRTLRIDIQGDTTIQPHKGFQAAVRSVSLSVPAGRRQKSTMYHGLLTTTKKPLLQRRTRPTTKPPTTTTTTVKPTVITYGRKRGQIIYGPDFQPRKSTEIKTIKTGIPQTTVILYAFIGVFCFCVVLAGIAFIFRKQLYAKYKAFKRKRKDKKATEENENNKKKEDLNTTKSDSGVDNRAFSNNEFELSEYHPSTPSLDGRRRRSVVFEDEVLAGLERVPIQRNTSSDNFDNESELSKSQKSLSNLQTTNTQIPTFQGWNYPNGEPIYEDDTMSVQSFSSVRSANRHPDHSSFKTKKIMEKNKALLGEKENIYADHGEPIYHVGAPVMMPHFNAMVGYPGIQSMYPQYDPRLGYSMRPEQYDPYSRGHPLMPPSYHDNQGDISMRYQRNLGYQAHNQDRSLIEYPQSNLHMPRHQRSQDDINIHHSKRELDFKQSRASLRSARSMTDVNESGTVDQFDAVRPSKSMADLPLETEFLQRRLTRSQSFSM